MISYLRIVRGKSHTRINLDPRCSRMVFVGMIGDGVGIFQIDLDELVGIIAAVFVASVDKLVGVTWTVAGIAQATITVNGVGDRLRLLNAGVVKRDGIDL